MQTYMEMTNVGHSLTESERKKIRDLQRGCILGGVQDAEEKGRYHLADLEPPRHPSARRSLVAFCRKCGASHVIHPYSDQNTK